MKLFPLILIILFSSVSMASTWQILPLDESARDDDVEYVYVELENDLEFSDELHNLVFSSIDTIEKENCTKDNFVLQKFKKNEEENIYYAIYSVEDGCDGGNSMGIILDSEENYVAEVFDGDFDL